MFRVPVLVFLTCALVLGVMAVPRAFAQDATPAAGEIVDPAQCQVEPRSAESLAQLAGTPAADQGAATPAVSEDGEPTGEEADQATVDAVTATYRELIACLNAGDFLRAYALYSDAYLQRTLAGGGFDLAQLEATPVPSEEQQRTSLVDVGEVRQLDGDRVAARVTTSNPSVDGNIVVDAILVRSGDRLLIDEETVVEAPVEGTPATAEAGAATGTGAESVEVVSYDIYFEPEEVSIPADTDVTFALPNEGVTLHNFSIDELAIDVDIDPGATEEMIVNAPAGTYDFYCNIPGHRPAGMEGVLTVG
jgi:uncharacterized cupredoxin-like copper-binding protein